MSLGSRFIMFKDARRSARTLKHTHAQPNAEAVRSDLKALSGRTATIGSRQPCARCGRALLDQPPNLAGLPSGGSVPQFYVYPTGAHMLSYACEHGNLNCLC